MTELVAAARLVLACIFIVSAIAKVRDRSGSHEAVRAFGVPEGLAPGVAAGLPLAELACAALLVLPDPLATTGAVLSLAMLAAFTGAIVYNLSQGRRPACHCFGSLGDESEIGWGTVGRNAAFVVLAAISLGGGRAVWSVAADLSAVHALAWAGGLLLVGAVILLALAVQTLMAKYGETLIRLEALEVATGLVEPPSVPDFSLPDLDGVQQSLDEALEAGKPVMVAFVSPSCSLCTELLPDLAAWQSAAEHPVGVLVLSDGPVEANREKISDTPALRLLLQSDTSLSDQLGVQGTPGAVLIGPDGRMIGPAAYGADGVRQMHRSITDSLAGGADDPHVHQIEPRPVSAGDPVPEVLGLTTESGEAWPTEAVLADDPVLLFWRFDCGFCEQIVDQVREIESHLPLRIVTTSTTEAIRDTGLNSPILRDPMADLESWLNVPGTPSAARIRDGALASDVAVGGPEVMALLQSVAHEAALRD